MIDFKTDLPQVDDFEAIFLKDTPLLDVRAPIEYEQGAFPHTRNLPLMNDEERHEIGIRYKQAGNDAAIRLGMEKVNETVRQPRIAAWQDFFEKHPDALLYCFRGGLRSKIVQQLLFEHTGKVYPRVAGGYKAMRRYLIDETERLVEKMDFTLLGGRTGAGKTRLLHQLPAMIDLEGLANHRGSAFGPRVTGQPSQIDFENRLAISLLKAEQQSQNHLLLEDEGKNIGSVHLPHSLIEKMQQSPIVMLEVEDEERVQISLQEYVIDTLAEHQQLAADEQLGFGNYRQALLGSLNKIRKRLGGVRYKELYAQMEMALNKQEQGEGAEAHKALISRLLFEYYDPMYDYQISNKQQRICFSGNRDEVSKWWLDRIAG